MVTDPNIAVKITFRSYSAQFKANGIKFIADKAYLPNRLIAQNNRAVSHISYIALAIQEAVQRLTSVNQYKA